MIPRPHRNASIAELEALFSSSGNDRDKLLLLREELAHRSTNRALVLRGKLDKSFAAAPRELGRDDDGNVDGGLTSSTGETTKSNLSRENRMSDLAKEPELEVPEGLGDDDDSSWGDYPIDTLLIRSENRTVHDILRRIEKGSFVMDPEFQRDFIWPEDKQSKLIESVMMRIPLPVFYLAEDEVGRLIVVDGLQRLSTFQRFVNNELRLKLPGQSDIHNKRFNELSPKLQNRVEDCNLLLYVIDAKVPERARLDIFERVNGGIPLTRQQMRNCLFMGPATQFIKQEAKTELFRTATGRSLDTNKMRDREFVNRFCAFQLLPIASYRGDMDDFLAQALRRMNSLSADQLEALSQEFKTSLTNNHRVFREHAFRKYSEPGGRRSVINASLWDVMSTGLSRISPDVAESHAAQLWAALKQLFDDDRFNAAITYSTNDTRRVTVRFQTATTMIREVFGAPET